MNTIADIMKKGFKIFPLFLVIVLVGCSLKYSTDAPQPIPSNPGEVSTTFPGLRTNTSKTSIDLDLVLNGGPGKDGIPALNNPEFVSIQESEISDDVLGIFIELNAEQRFYPYNILVWHEIVNDTIEDTHFAVTFCPLCGSAIVFDRNVNEEILHFGVSGLLYESNLLMYDDKTESLWSQAFTKAVIGDYIDTQLEILPMQVIDFKELKEKYPSAKVLSTNTGYQRDYTFYPYGSYEGTEEIKFPISIQDKRFFAKEMMYVVPVEDNSVAFVLKNIPTEGEIELEVKDQKLRLYRSNNEINTTYNGQELPGYYEMWFSWAIHHQEDGIVWEKE